LIATLIFLAIRSKSSANDVQVAQKKHPNLKLTFRDSVTANRKIPNSTGGTFTETSDTRVGSTEFGDGKKKQV